MYDKNWVFVRSRFVPARAPFGYPPALAISAPPARQDVARQHNEHGKALAYVVYCPSERARSNTSASSTVCLLFVEGDCLARCSGHCVPPHAHTTPAPPLSGTTKNMHP